MVISALKLGYLRASLRGEAKFLGKRGVLETNHCVIDRHANLLVEKFLKDRTSPKKAGFLQTATGHADMFIHKPALHRCNHIPQCESFHSKFHSDMIVGIDPFTLFDLQLYRSLPLLLSKTFHVPDFLAGAE